MTDATAAPHPYFSTACLHGECGACRNTCKYCDASCSCPHHQGGTPVLPVPWVDQARDMALLLLGYLDTTAGVPEDLRQRIASDRALFWLRGETMPPGEWHGDGEGEAPS